MKAFAWTVFWDIALVCDVVAVVTRSGDVLPGDRMVTVAHFCLVSNITRLPNSFGITCYIILLLQHYRTSVSAVTVKTNFNKILKLLQSN